MNRRDLLMTPCRVRPCGHTFSFYFGDLETDPLTQSRRVWALSSSALKVSQPMEAFPPPYLWTVTICQKSSSYFIGAHTKQSIGSKVSKATKWGRDRQQLHFRFILLGRCIIACYAFRLMLNHYKSFWPWD